MSKTVNITLNTKKAELRDRYLALSSELREAGYRSEFIFDFLVDSLSRAQEGGFNKFKKYLGGTK